MGANGRTHLEMIEPLRERCAGKSGDLLIIIPGPTGAGRISRISLLEHLFRARLLMRFGRLEDSKSLGGGERVGDVPVCDAGV